MNVPSEMSNEARESEKEDEKGRKYGRRESEYAENRNGIEEIHMAENCGRVETVKSFRIASHTHTHTT